MLQNIHNRIQGWIAGVIVALIAVTFTLWGVQSYLEGHSHNAMKAKVGGVEISQTEFQNAYQRLRRQQQMQLGANFALTPAVIKQLRQQALQQLIMNTALRHAALADGYFISEKQAEEAISHIPAFQEDGQFSEERFIQTLNAALYTPESFIQQLQSDMLVNQLRAGIITTAFALPSDVQQAIQLIDQQRSIRYMLIPAKAFAKSVKPSDEAMQAYYAKHKQQFTHPEKISLSYLQLSLKEMMATLKFTDQQLQTYYKENLSNYKKPPRWHVAHILIDVAETATVKQVEQAKQKAEKVYKQATGGQDFAKLAKEYSADALSAKDGGVLPWITPGTLSPQFEQAVALLNKPGQISRPVRTKHGFEIIKLLDIEKAKQLPFAEVKAQIKNTLAAQKAQTHFAELSDQLANLTYSNPDSLEAAAKELKLSIKTTPMFTREGGKEGITKNKKVLAAAFSPEVLENGDNSDVIQINNDAVVVIRINKHEPAKAIPFAEVKDKIRGSLIAEQSQTAAKKYADSLLKDINRNAEQQLNLMMRARDLKWQTAENLRRNNSELYANIVELAFQLPRPNKGKQHPSGIVQLENGDYAIVSLEKVSVSDSKQAAEQRQIFKQQIENSMGLYDYALYVRGIMADAKIKTYDNT